jgi:ribonucleoside-diphosphate reductase alpha chain
MDIQTWLKNDKLGIDIWTKKYRWQNESFDEFLERVSLGIPEIKKLIAQKKFLPGGRILAGIGTQSNRKICFSNCSVTPPPKDNIESIFDTAKLMARSYASGEGCGTTLDYLSPKGAMVNNAAKNTTGAISFAELYSTVTKLIGQEGRRGALLLCLSVTHPDILEFIRVKDDLEAVTYANLSVKITDNFIHAYLGNLDWETTFTRPETGETITRKIPASLIMREIATHAWRTGEPGVLFIDTINNWHSQVGHPDYILEATNPCGEQPLINGGVCNLFAINLAEYVSFGHIDKNELERDTAHIMKYANRVLDINIDLLPLEIQKQQSKDWRQIGVGIMGLADALIKMKLTYGEKEAIYAANEFMMTIANAAYQSSAKLAKMHGSYPAFDFEIVENSPFVNNLYDTTINMIEDNGLYNACILTIAPTGSISTMLGISGGCEPMFALEYERTTKSLHSEDVKYIQRPNIVSDYMEVFQLKTVNDLPSYFITSHQIDWKKRIDMQSSLQEYVDSAISSTINLPESTSISEIEELYLYAWEHQLKGLTVFRDNCFRTGILNIVKEEVETEIIEELKSPAIVNFEKEYDSIWSKSNLPRGAIIHTSNDLYGKKRKLQTGCGTMHIEAWFDPDSGELREVFFNKGSEGGCERFMQSTSRLASLALRGGVEIAEVLDQLDTCKNCSSYVTRTKMKGDTSPGTSCPTAIARAIKEMQEEMDCEMDKELEYIFIGSAGTGIGSNNKPVKIVFEGENQWSKHKPCPECGHEMMPSGGCTNCPNCGYTKCD